MKFYSKKVRHITRTYGGEAKQIGHYWTETKPSGSLQTRIDSALDWSWGNTTEYTTSIKVPAGTTVYKGIAESQGALTGGGSQVFISDLNPTWLVE